MKSLKKMATSYYHYCAISVLMFWEYYLQGRNGTIHAYFMLWLDITFVWLPCFF